jgi:hypothetical protein
MANMNPSLNETAGTQPVPPVTEQGLGVSSTPEAGPTPAEQAPIVSEIAPATGQEAALPPISFPLPNLPLSATPPANVPIAQPQATGAIVDDGDLIEKEWVNKAKQIVELNRDNPYKQSEELTVFKADYMKKRYGKTIKLNN